MFQSSALISYRSSYVISLRSKQEQLGADQPSATRRPTERCSTLGSIASYIVQRISPPKSFPFLSSGCFLPLKMDKLTYSLSKTHPWKASLKALFVDLSAASEAKPFIETSRAGFSKTVQRKSKWLIKIFHQKLETAIKRPQVKRAMPLDLVEKEAGSIRFTHDPTFLLSFSLSLPFPPASLQIVSKQRS
jgi:hypothetical protein